jgi:hypothetical protein
LTYEEEGEHLTPKQSALAIVTGWCVAAGAVVLGIYLLVPAILVLALWLGLFMIVLLLVPLLAVLSSEFVSGRSSRRGINPDEENSHG